MDTFKLLARSTGLQKSGANGRVQAKELPSAGLSNDPDTDNRAEQDLAVSQIHTIQGRKRKRGGDIPEELDFFGGHATIQRDGEGKPLPIHNGKPPSREEEPEQRIEMVGEDVCKQILKKHKLKVTVLDDSKIYGKRVKSQPGVKTTQDSKDGNARTQIWPQPLTHLGQLRQKYGISRRLSENLAAQGYREPTEVQIAALPLLLGTDQDRGFDISKHKERPTSKVDLVTVAPTGSGKTLAFLIPILQNLVAYKHSKTGVDNPAASDSNLQAIILAPTHELVDQIVNEARKIGSGIGVKVTALKKGMSLGHGSENVTERDSVDLTEKSEKYPVVKADVLISTPMMMLNAISDSSDNEREGLPSIRYLVLDEADVLLDPLFREQTLGIWQSCTNPSLQTTLWSATIGSSIESLACNFILERRRRRHRQHSDSKTRRENPRHRILRLVVGLKDSAIPLINHRLTYAATEQGKLLALRQILHPGSNTTTTAHSVSQASPPTLQPPFLIFTQTIPRAIALHSELLYDIPPEAGGSSRIAVLHADLSTKARADIMSNLRRGEVWVVITTDLLARGVDIRGMNGVINYDIPTTGAAYIHRAGRTGRQGRRGGIAITLYTSDDIPYVKNIANVIAASERSAAAADSGKSNQTQEGGGAAPPHSRDTGTGIQQWLLDALPTLSKATRKRLKTRGVESRRPAAAAGGPRAGDGHGHGREGAVDDKAQKHSVRRTRISTKSGYDRRLEGRRKRKRDQPQQDRVEGKDDLEGNYPVEEEWAGLE